MRVRRTTPTNWGSRANRTAADVDAISLRALCLWLVVFGLALYLLAGWPPFVPVLQDAGLPTWISVEVWLRSPALGIDAALPAARLLAWVVWGWTCATVLLRVGVNALELATNGATWVRSVRLASDWLTLPLVRRAVDASLAGIIMARVAMPFPVEAASLPATSARQVARTIDTKHRLPSLTTESLVNRDAHLVFGTEQDPTEQAESPAAAGDELVYTIRGGDTWWGIAERFYDDGSRAEELLERNIGRLQDDGRQITRRGFIYPGWTISIPGATRGIVHEHDGQRWYTVAAGDTLSGIAKAILGEETRWPELFELNRGQARLDESHVLHDASLIWPGLVLQLPDDGSVPDGDENVTVESVPPGSPEPPAVPVAPAATAALSPVQKPVAPPAATPISKPAVSISAPSTPVEPAEAAPPPQQADSPASLPPRELVEIGGIAAGLSVAVWLALKSRHRAPRAPAVPETDTELDEHAFSRAAPAAVFAARRDGGDDPHGIVLGELLANELLGRARGTGLTDIELVTVSAGRRASELSFAAALHDRPLLEATLRASNDLARRVSVARSEDQDVVVRLEGVRREVLSAGLLEAASPVLLCLGLHLDGRACLVGWEAFGHVVIATQPGTTDAQEHAAALVATLAGQRSPGQLRLYTLAGQSSPLADLAPLPQQRACVDPNDADATASLLAGLRGEVEARQSGHWTSLPELVLVVAELATVIGDDDLAYVLRHGRECGVRVLAATADLPVQQSVVMDSFDSRIVFALDDEEASIRLLGKAWAVTLAEPGRALVRLGRRREVELRGLRLTEAGRDELLAQVAVSRLSEPDEPVTPEHPQDGPQTGGGLDEQKEADAHGNTPQFATPASDALREEHGPNSEARQHAAPVLVDAVDAPVRVAHLLSRVPLVVDCDGAAVWSREGRLQLERGSLLELLMYIAASPLLNQGSATRWPGVSVETVLDEVWSPRARDARNRESGVTWLRKTLSRVRSEVARLVGGGIDDELVVECDGNIQLNPAVAVSDVGAFLLAVERARNARGAEQLQAAEEAVVLRPPALLPVVPREGSAHGRKFQIYGWLDQPEWERAARRLDALGLDAMNILGRAHRDAGQHTAAMTVYSEMLTEDALDRRAQEGLLAAAAATGDATQLADAWQQVCACLDGDIDIELRALYESLVHQVVRLSGSGESTQYEVLTVRGGR